jgi:acetyltransferase
LADQAFELPPLNLTLAHSLVQHARPVRDATADQQEVTADALVRVSQLIIDFPEIDTLEFGAFGQPDLVTLTLREAGQFGRVAIAPYPGFLVEAWQARGETVTIRPIRPEDAAGHAALFTRLSSEDIRYRFFSALREISPERIARMTQIDYDREMAFVAIRPNGDTAGVSRLVREPNGAGEFAIIVDPAMRGTGLARRLMERIIDWGAQEGLTRIEGQVLADNMPMKAFIRRLGFSLHRLPEERDVLDARLELAPR